MTRRAHFTQSISLLALLAALAGCGGGGDTTSPDGGGVTQPAAVATVSITPSSGPLLVGGSLTLAATLRDAAGNTLAGRAVAWTSSAQSVATVTQAGVVTAVAVGTATITAASEGKSGTATITVTAPPAAAVATVTITTSTNAMVVGGSLTLAVDLKDAAGNALTGRAIAWSSSTPGVASITQGGVVTAVALGTATITATSEGRSGTASVTVSNPFNPTTSTTLAGTRRFTSVNIPAGVTVTVTGDLDLSASGAITIAGTLTGNCVAMTVAADSVASVTGTVSNACSDVNAEGKDLTILGKTRVSVTGPTINSSGNILITNDLTLTEANFPAPAGTFITGRSATYTADAATRAAVVQALPDCAFAGVRPAPPPARAGAPSETQFLGGAAGKKLKVACRGNGELGRPAVVTAIPGQAGGAGGPASKDDNNFAEARAGDGGAGGAAELWVTGNLVIAGVTNLISGDGGAGGNAVATGLSNPGRNKQANAQATGGKGGEPGLIDIRFGGVFTINAALNIVIGRAGDGGNGTATGAPGLDATAISPAKEGGDANATGGEGGSTPNRSASALGAFVGANLITISGGRAGNAGRATGTAGVGGIGNETFPTGGKGGSLLFNRNNAGNGSNARVGLGGNAQLRNLLGALFGRGGDGSVTSGNGGNGGAGWNDCNVPRKPGGVGGQGGSVAGRDGAGGTGAPNGASGGITLTNVGNGGRGGNGQAPGDGGNPGSDASTSLLPKVMNGSNFVKGAPGNPCPPLPVRLGVQADPNGHEPFVGYLRVNALTVTTNGTTITITGPAPWVTLTGTLNANGSFVATGFGTVAGFPEVPVRFTGTVTSTGAMSGTIQIGQSAQPTGLPNGPVTYSVTPGN